MIGIDGEKASGIRVLALCIALVSGISCRGGPLSPQLFHSFPLPLSLLLLTRCWLSVTVVSRCTDHAADKRHAPCKSKNWHTTHTLKYTHAHSVALQIVTHSAMNHGGRTRNNQSQLCLELTIDLSGSDKKHQQIQGMTA